MPADFGASLKLFIAQFAMDRPKLPTSSLHTGFASDGWISPGIFIPK
jgi:hypothetical protein